MQIWTEKYLDKKDAVRTRDFLIQVSFKSIARVRIVPANSAPLIIINTSRKNPPKSLNSEGFLKLKCKKSFFSNTIPKNHVFSGVYRPVSLTLDIINGIIMSRIDAEGWNDEK